MDTGNTYATTGDYIVFLGHECLCRGRYDEAVERATQAAREKNAGPLLIFRNSDATPLESTGPGMWEDEPREETASSAGSEERQPTRGRPKLGVTAREVTLLPRHWEWLEQHPAGASAKLRELVEKALRAAREPERRSRAFEAVERFANALAGDLPHAEEASRALYAGRLDEVRRLTEVWPAGVRGYYLELAARTLPAAS